MPKHSGLQVFAKLKIHVILSLAKNPCISFYPF